MIRILHSIGSLFKDKTKEELKDEALYFIRAKKPQRVVWAVFRHALLIGVSFIILYPILYMISTAFKPQFENYDPAVIWLPKSPTLSNFIDALSVLNLSEILGTTLMLTLLTTVFQVVMCLVVGYGFARFKFRGSKILFALVLLTIIVPQQTISTSLYYQYRYFDLFGILDFASKLTGGVIQPINLIGTYWVSWLPALLGTGLRSGLYIYIYRQYFLGMPRELEEAAYIDGCGPYKTFYKIMLPNTKNIVLTILLFSSVWNWNDYYTPATFMKNSYTISTALADFQKNLQNLSSVGGNYVDPIIVNTRIQAACLLVIAPLLLLYVFTQRYFTESIENSGITGI